MNTNDQQTDNSLTNTALELKQKTNSNDAEISVVTSGADALVNDFIHEAHMDISVDKTITTQQAIESLDDGSTEEVEVKILKPNVAKMGSGITNLTRPDNLDDIVGMQTAIRQVRLSTKGSFLRNQPLPSFLITGPSGCGKSTIAKVIHKEAGNDSRFYNVPASDITSPGDLYQLAQTLRDGDVVFLEEAHALGGGGKKAKIIQSILYEWLEDYKLSGLGAGGGITDAPKVCFIFATTDPGKLLEPLRNRCERIDLQFYSVDEIKTIIIRAAAKLGIGTDLDDEALTMLAKSSRGIPRIAIMQRLRPLMDLMIVENLPFSAETVESLFEFKSLHPLGLEPNDMLYCHCLYESMRANGNKPVSSKTIQSMTGLTDNLVEQLIEPYLMKSGVVVVTGRGRMITDHGFEVLGLKPLLQSGSNASYRLDTSTLEDKIDNLVKDDGILKQGTAAAMAKVGLNYQDITERATFKAALLERGYEIKRKSGIVKVRTSSLQSSPTSVSPMLSLSHILSGLPEEPVPQQPRLQQVR